MEKCLGRLSEDMTDGTTLSVSTRCRFVLSCRISVHQRNELFVVIQCVVFGLLDVLDSSVLIALLVLVALVGVLGMFGLIAVVALV